VVVRQSRHLLLEDVSTRPHCLLEASIDANSGETPAPDDEEKRNAAIRSLSLCANRSSDGGHAQSAPNRRYGHIGASRPRAIAGALGVGRLAAELLDVASWPHILCGCGYASLAIGLPLVGAQRELEDALRTGGHAPLRFRTVGLLTVGGDDDRRARDRADLRRSGHRGRAERYGRGGSGCTAQRFRRDR
jgi:hypothetical protein